jgi:hypothetical protein
MQSLINNIMKCIQNLLGIPEGKRPLRRHNQRLEDITGCEDVNWIQQAKDRVQ